MTDQGFRAWFSDVGFTCRVLIIADMLDEWADTWEAGINSDFRAAIDEVRETAILEMVRWAGVGTARGYFLTKSPPPPLSIGASAWLDITNDPSPGTEEPIE